MIAIILAFLTNRADGDCVVIGYAVHVHLRASIEAHIVPRSAIAVTHRQRHTFRIGLTNRQIVFAESTRIRRATNAKVAIVATVAARWTTKCHLIDIAARSAFLTGETPDDVVVIGHAERIRRITHVAAHLVALRTRVVTGREIRAIGTEGARLQFV